MKKRAGAASLQDKRYRALVRRLVAARTAAHMTQAQMAEVLGVTQNAVSRIEHHDRRLDALEFLLWCKACDLQLSLNDLQL